MNPTVSRVTQRIIERSRGPRAAYLARIAAARDSGPHRRRLSCGNLAHGFAACNVGDKASLRAAQAPNLAIVTAYNDMLSAHQPFAARPRVILPPIGSNGPGLANVTQTLHAKIRQLVRLYLPFAHHEIERSDPESRIAATCDRCLIRPPIACRKLTASVLVFCDAGSSS